MARAALDNAGRRAAAQPLHGRDRRRRLPDQPAGGHRLLDRGRRRAAGGVLRPRVRRHRRGQQDLGEDRRRGHRPVRPGLLRLRLQEVRLGDRVPSPDGAAADPLQLPDRAGHLRRLPPVPLPGPHGRARPGRPRGHLPAQQPLAGGPGLGAPAQRGPARDHRQGPRPVGGGRRPGGPRGRHGPPDQHRHAALLLRPFGVLPRDQAVAAIKAWVEKAFSRRGEEVVARNFAAIDGALDALHRVEVPPRRPAPATGARPCPSRRPTSSSGSRPG